MKRPVLFDYKDLALFVKDMIRFLKQEDPDFTVARACRNFERCSPALISNIIAGKRKLTSDRVGDIAALLNLSARERYFLKEKVLRKAPDEPASEEAVPSPAKRRRRSSFILKNWLHPYVKDATRLEAVKMNKEAIFKVLGGIASRKRIQQSLTFLLQHGYLRLDLAGQWVESEVLDVVGDRNASGKVRQFHKKALDIAKTGLDLYPMEERLAQALLLPLDEESYSELVDLVREFSEKLQVFSETKTKNSKRLYQIIVHLTPTGGSRA